MRKTIFLFFLSLSVYGVVNVKAQVRIGNDSAPHPAAVLDLNPCNTADAKGGFLLPRVRLYSVEDTGVFGAGVTPERGLVVYNRNEDNDIDRPEEGVYCYNGEEWILISGNFQAPVPALTWYNTEVSKNFNRDNCGAGYIGSVVPYIVPAMQHPSTVSQARANTNALYEASTNGQAHADTVGVCIPIPYSDTGDSFSIEMMPKTLWLGRDGELGEEWTVTFPPGLDLSGYLVEYVWYFKDDTETQQEVVSVVTTRPVLQIPVVKQDEIKRGKVYKLSCSVHVGRNYETDTVDAGKVVYGTGAWIGPGEWLNVANANVGGDQSIPLFEQLAKDHWSAYNREVMGDRFQWGRDADRESENVRHELIDSETYPDNIPGDKINDQGTPTGDAYGKFALSGTYDWRSYPNDMSTNELRKKWYWRTMEEPDIGVDPCSPAMDIIPGKWFVMTLPQWDSIRANNRVAWMETDYANGVAIYPNRDSTNISFYLPTGPSRSGADGRSSANTSWHADLWLNSYNDSVTAIRLRWEKGAIDGIKNDTSRADGLPIRCVSE